MNEKLTHQIQNSKLLVTFLLFIKPIAKTAINRDQKKRMR